MASFISAAAAIAMVNALTALVDTGSQLEIYNGEMPEDADTPLDEQELLVAFDFASPDAFADAVDTINGAVATANAIDPADGLVTDTATWGRVINNAGDTLIIGDVSNPAGTGAIKISSTAITTGVEVSVISLSYTQPK
jgi:hypothetical protein